MSIQNELLKNVYFSPERGNEGGEVVSHPYIVHTHTWGDLEQDHKLLGEITTGYQVIFRESDFKEFHPEEKIQLRLRNDIAHPGNSTLLRLTTQTQELIGLGWTFFHNNPDTFIDEIFDSYRTTPIVEPSNEALNYVILGLYTLEEKHHIAYVADFGVLPSFRGTPATSFFINQFGLWTTNVAHKRDYLCWTARNSRMEKILTRLGGSVVFTAGPDKSADVFIRGSYSTLMEQLHI
jgi:hypothetical protein